MNLSRTKFIIVAVMILILFGIAGFLLYTRNTPATQPTSGIAPIGIVGGGAPTGTALNPNIRTQRPGSADALSPAPQAFPVTANPAQRLIRLTDFPVIAPSLNKAEDAILFYKKDGGDLYISDFEGTRQDKISHITILGLMDAAWSPLRDRAAIRYLDGNTIKAFLHIGTSSVAVLPSGITSAAWSPDGKSLALTKPEGSVLTLIIADSSGKNQKTVLRTPITDARAAWISQDRVALFDPPSAFAEGYIFSYNTRTGALEKIFGPGYGIQAMWSPYETRMIASYTPRGGASLQMQVLNPLDPERKDSRAINLATLAEKCTFLDKQEIWCAVPRDIANAGALPDQYLTGEFASQDRIVSIYITANEISELFNEQDFDITDLHATKNKNRLFFVNRRDGTLWTLKLK